MKAKLLPAALLALLLVGCEETSELQEVELPVAAVQTAGFPKAAVRVDTTLSLKVLFQPANGCGRFSRADSVKTDKVTEIKLFAAYPTQEMNAVCTDVAKLNTVTFNYRTTTPGKHYFRFWQAEGKYLEEVVEVK
ncbi:hypothetical protein [Rufibacter soli]